MKKLLFFAAALICSASVASAQTFSKDAQVISAGIGFGGGYGVPISLSYEHGVYDINEKSSIGVGGYLGFGSHKEDIPTIVEYKYNDIFIAATGSYHFTGVNKFDFYGSLRLGYNAASVNYDWYDKDYDTGAYDVSVGGLAYALVAGARYYFSDNWAANAELGYGLATLNVGVSYKF